MIRLTKISWSGPNWQIMSLFAHFPIVSYQPWTPLGQSINKYTAHLGKLNRSVFAFMRGSRGGSGPPGESCTMLRTKNKELFSDSRAWTPPAPPWQKFLDLHMALHSVLIIKVQYRVCDIPVKGLWASSIPMRPLTCHLSNHVAYLKCYSLAYFYKKFQLLLGGKEREGATHCKV